MRTNTIISISGTAVLFLAAILLFFQWRKKKRDEEANNFMQELDLNLNPVRAARESEVFDLNAPPLPSSNRLTEKQARDKAEAIYDAIGWFYDDEPQIFSVLESCAGRGQVQQVNKAYFALYSTSLMRDLEENLDEEEMKEVMRIVNSKNA